MILVKWLDFPVYGRPDELNCFCLLLLVLFSILKDLVRIPQLP